MSYKVEYAQSSRLLIESSSSSIPGFYDQSYGEMMTAHKAYQMSPYEPTSSRFDSSFHSSASKSISIAALLQRSSLTVLPEGFEDTWNDVCVKNLSSFELNDYYLAIFNFSVKFGRCSRFERSQILKDNEEVISMLKSTLMDHAHELNADQIARLAFSFAKIGIEDPVLYARLSEVACEKINTFNAVNLSDLAWGFAKSGMDDEKLFNLISDRAVLKIKEFPAAKLTNLAWAFAVCSFPIPKLFTAINQQILTQFHRFNAFDLSTLAWSFTITFPQIFNYDLVLQKLNSMAWSLNEAQAIPLYHALSSLEGINWDSYNDLYTVLTNHISKIEHGKQPDSSKFHKEVESLLNVLDLYPNSEFFAAGYFIDMILNMDGTLIAIEVDGPCHYLQSGRVKGGGELKHVVLEKAGFSVIHIPYYEWQELGILSKRLDYLKRLINPTKQENNNPLLQLQKSEEQSITVSTKSGKEEVVPPKVTTLPKMDFHMTGQSSDPRDKSIVKTTAPIPSTKVSKLMDSTSEKALSAEQIAKEAILKAQLLDKIKKAQIKLKTSVTALPTKSGDKAGQSPNPISNNFFIAPMASAKSSEPTAPVSPKTSVKMEIMPIQSSHKRKQMESFTKNSLTSKQIALEESLRAEVFAMLKKPRIKTETRKQVVTAPLALPKTSIDKTEQPSVPAGKNSVSTTLPMAPKAFAPVDLASILKSVQTISTSLKAPQNRGGGLGDLLISLGKSIKESTKQNSSIK